ncbi:MAG: hypothetical protein ACYC8T_36630, partial [Myxococcaceae bacterium]
MGRWSTLVLVPLLCSLCSVPAEAADAPLADAPTAQPVESAETSWITVASIGATTYFLSSMIHEGLGHGGACLLAGGRVDALSTAVAGCNEASGPRL